MKQKLWLLELKAWRWMYPLYKLEKLWGDCQHKKYSQWIRRRRDTYPLMKLRVYLGHKIFGTHYVTVRYSQSFFTVHRVDKLPNGTNVVWVRLCMYYFGDNLTLLNSATQNGEDVRGHSDVLNYAPLTW